MEKPKPPAPPSPFGSPYPGFKPIFIPFSGQITNSTDTNVGALGVSIPIAKDSPLPAFPAYWRCLLWTHTAGLSFTKVIVVQEGMKDLALWLPDGVPYPAFTLPGTSGRISLTLPTALAATGFVAYLIIAVSGIAPSEAI